MPYRQICIVSPLPPPPPLTKRGAKSWMVKGVQIEIMQNNVNYVNKRYAPTVNERTKRKSGGLKN